LQSPNGQIGHPALNQLTSLISNKIVPFIAIAVCQLYLGVDFTKLEFGQKDFGHILSQYNG
jgi:hypothetical protein